MIEMNKDEIIDCLNNKISQLESKLSSIRNDHDLLLEQHKIAMQGLEVIVESGDCGGISKKTIEEIEKIK